MHEAGIAASILEIAESVAAEHGSGSRIGTVKVRIGQFTGVAVEALTFAFEAMRTDTACAAAVLEVERVPLTGMCVGCGWTGVPEEDFCLLCPCCRKPVEVIAGRELEVEYVEFMEDEQEHAGGRSSNVPRNC